MGSFYIRINIFIVVKRHQQENFFIFYISATYYCRSYWSSGGSLVATQDCKTWVRIQQSPQPTVDRKSLDGPPSGMVLHYTVGYPLRGSREK